MRIMVGMGGFEFLLTQRSCKCYYIVVCLLWCVLCDTARLCCYIVAVDVQLQSDSYVLGFSQLNVLVLQ